MKDYFGLTNDELLKLIQEEIRYKRFENALIVWGMINFECDDKKRYYLASILVRMGKIDEGIYWAKKVTEPRFKEHAQTVILEAYSKAGRIEEFTDYFVNDFSGKIGSIQLMNYIYKLVYISKHYIYAENEYMNNLLNQMIDSNKCSVGKGTIEKKDFDKYLLNTLQFTSLYIEALKESMDIYTENNLEGTANAVAKAYGLYNLVSMCFPQFADDFPISDFLDDYEGTLSVFLKATKQNIINMDESDDKWMIYYAILDRISDENTLINEVYDGLGYFPKLIANYGYEAVYPLVSAYAKAINCEDYRVLELEKVLMECGVTYDTISNATIYESVMSQLSVKSQIAYKSACSLYTLAKSNNYEQKDAGPISLAFYRILEMESNIAIWKPIIKKVTFDELQRIYDELSKKDRRKWEVLVSIFKEIESDDDGNGLMFGNLRALIRNIKDTDKLANKLREEFYKVLTDEGRNAFESGLIDEWYSKENADKYRNPPAHAKYLHFEMVESCKIYVETEILNMGKWIRRGLYKE